MTKYFGGILPMDKVYNCLHCRKENKWSYRHTNQYCDQHCMNEKKYAEFISRWKNGKEDGFKGKQQTSKRIKRYVIEKFNNTCQGCGITGQWNGKPLTLQLEHLDGNSWNNKEENLSLLCPNCHTQTEFYGSKNKGRGRGSLIKSFIPE
jgi:hypothetical protein